MPRIDTQKAYRYWPKPNFCYLCGNSLEGDEELDDDHCPPASLFLSQDRSNYPIILKVHKRCNQRWSATDERFATVYAMMHGRLDRLGGNRREPEFHNVQNEQGTFLGMSRIPLRELAFRIVRCAHALLYGEWLPSTTPNSIHIPIPEVDRSMGNRPKPHLPQFYSFGNVLCTAQKTGTVDAIIAWHNRFKYVTTWTHADKGEPFCVFAFDIYELHKLGIVIQDFPKAVIGSYRRSTPVKATTASRLQFDNSDSEILYPILI